MNGYGVQILAQNQINLEILDLSGCVGINDEAVKEICKNLTKLKVLSLNNCIKVICIRHFVIINFTDTIFKFILIIFQISSIIFKF